MSLAIGIGIGPTLGWGVGASGPRAPTAVVLPTPSFGASNLLAWYDCNKTFTDSSGVAQPSINYDTVGHNSVASWEDISGNGNGLWCSDKTFQPTKGVNGGAYFDSATAFLDCVNKSLFNGLTQVSIYACLRPDIVVGGAKRTLLYASEGNTSGIMLGVGSIAVPGALFAVGDQGVLTGGTASTQCVVEVLAVTAGVPTSVGIINPGAYTVFPSNPVSLGSVTNVNGGASSGSGLTLNMTPSTIGNGSSVERLGLYASSGSTGRKAYLATSAQDGAQNTTSTSANKSIGLANGAALNDTTTKVREGWELDYSASPATYAAYQNGTLDTTQTWTPAEAGPPWTLGTNDAVTLRMGNNSTPNSPLYMEVVAMIILGEIPSSGRRALIDTYLAGL